MPKLLTAGSEEARAALAKAAIEVSAVPAEKTAKQEMRELSDKVKSKAVRDIIAAAGANLGAIN